jgi:hypothetical protein
MNAVLPMGDLPDVKNDFLVIFKDKETGRLIKFGWVDHEKTALDELKRRIKAHCEKNERGEVSELVEDDFIKSICGFSVWFKYDAEPKWANRNLIEAVTSMIEELQDMKTDLEDAITEWF